MLEAAPIRRANPPAQRQPERVNQTQVRPSEITRGVAKVPITSSRPTSPELEELIRELTKPLPNLPIVSEENK